MLRFKATMVPKAATREEQRSMLKIHVKPEMKVRVNQDWSLKPGKVVDPGEVTEAGTGKLIEIKYWVVALEPNGLHVRVTANKIYSRE